MVIAPPVPQNAATEGVIEMLAGVVQVIGTGVRGLTQPGENSST